MMNIAISKTNCTMIMCFYLLTNGYEINTTKLINKLLIYNIKC